jgi:hypothetical protein
MISCCYCSVYLVISGGGQPKPRRVNVHLSERLVDSLLWAPASVIFVTMTSLLLLSGRVARALSTRPVYIYHRQTPAPASSLLVRWASTHYDPIQIKQLVQEAVTLTNQNQQSAPPMKQLELQISDLERESSDPVFWEDSNTGNEINT